MSKAPITREIIQRFIKAALIWSIPALLLLPIYLVLVAISVLAGEGALLEATEGVRGGINAAMGPLLVVCGAVAGSFTAIAGSTAEDYISGGMFVIICLGLGTVLTRRALDHLAAAK